MEIVTVKIELERDDISAMLRLLGHKLSEEMWNKMKGQEYTLNDEDMQEQAGAMRLTFSVLAVGKLLNGDCADTKEKRSGPVKSFSERINAMHKQQEELRNERKPEVTNDEPVVF